MELCFWGGAFLHMRMVRQTGLRLRGARDLQLAHGDVRRYKLKLREGRECMLRARALISMSAS